MKKADIGSTEKTILSLSTPSWWVDHIHDTPLLKYFAHFFSFRETLSTFTCFSHIIISLFCDRTSCVLDWPQTPYVAQDDLYLFFWLLLPLRRAGIAGVWRLNLWLCLCRASILPAKLHTQPNCLNSLFPSHNGHNAKKGINQLQFRRLKGHYLKFYNPALFILNYYILFLIFL